LPAMRRDVLLLCCLALLAVPAAAAAGARVGVWQVSASAHFRILASPGVRPAADACARLEAIRDAFYSSARAAGYQPAPADQPLTWRLIATRADYDAYALRVDCRDASSLDGHYSARSSEVVLFGPRPGVDVVRLAHEAAHQLAFSSGLQRKGVAYPFWVAEGLATCCEGDGTDYGFGSPNPARRGRLMDAWRGGRLEPLSEFVKRVQPDSCDNGKLRDLYAQAWGLFACLSERRPEQLPAYMAKLAGPGPRQPLEAGFEDAFGSPSELEAQWRTFLQGLAAAEATAPAAGHCS
jgi:hypothetical protein